MVRMASSVGKVLAVLGKKVGAALLSGAYALRLVFSGGARSQALACPQGSA